MTVWNFISQLLMKLEFSGTLEASYYGFLYSNKMSLIKIQLVLILRKILSDLDSVACTLLYLLSLSLLLIINR